MYITRKAVCNSIHYKKSINIDNIYTNQWQTTEIASKNSKITQFFKTRKFLVICPILFIYLNVHVLERCTNILFTKHLLYEIF